MFKRACLRSSLDELPYLHILCMVRITSAFYLNLQSLNIEGQIHSLKSKCRISNFGVGLIPSARAALKHATVQVFIVTLVSETRRLEALAGLVLQRFGL